MLFIFTVTASNVSVFDSIEFSDATQFYQIISSLHWQGTS